MLSDCPIPKKLLLFDFDGVLVQSQAQLYEAISLACDKFFVQRASLEELQGMSSRELLAKLRVGPLRAMLMTRYCQKFLKQQKVPSLVEGLRVVLKSETKNSILGILSSSPRLRIETFIKQENLEGVFQYVVSDVSMWGKSAALERLARKQPGLIHLYVGDEDRDIIAAKKAFYKAISVAWGAKNPNFLRSQGPDYFVNNVEQLGGLLKVFD